MRPKHCVCLALFSTLLVSFNVGCAGTAGSARPISAVAKPEILSQYTKISLATSVEGEASHMATRDRERIAALVERKVKERAPNRFHTFNANTTDPETLHVTIEFTRYDDGNTVARLVQAGLGQIHIAAEVTLEDQSRHTIIGDYDVSKTFAWGGIYGAVTQIKDVEDGFADAVVNVLLGEAQK